MLKERYGPWCVIAGGSEGIGAGFADEIGKAGLNLVLIARKPEPLEELAQRLRARYATIEVRTCSMDLGSAGAAADVKRITNDLAVGLFIYNAGAECRYLEFLESDEADVASRMHLNFITKVELLHHFGRAMKKRGQGGIILMGSISGFLGSPGFALYGASKAFTHMLSESLWYELKKYGVDLCCSVIGPTRTPAMIKHFGLMAQMADPAYVVAETLNRLRSGPVWIADDIAAPIGNLINMNPADRAAFGARMNEAFALKKTTIGAISALGRGPEE